jgi:hypothetical protein
MRVGETFRFTDADVDDHLWIVISDPTAEEVVIVSLSTRRFGADSSCVLSPGDHPFVRHPTYVAYAFARRVATERLTAALASGDLLPDAPALSELLQRIWDGADVSRMLPLKCKALLATQGLIRP